MALGQSNIAGVARVAFETTGTGEATRDIAQLERHYTAATKDMSDGAIKLELAEDRLQRALKKGPSNYRAIASAELGVRRARNDLRGETDRLHRSEDARSRSLTRLRGNIVGYAAAYLGGAGLLFAIKSTLSAAREEELVLGQTKIAVEAAGLAWDRYASRIETVIRAQSALGFDDEKLMKTFAVFVRSTKDVDEALRLTALSADVARGRFDELEVGQQIVLKASIGMGGQLRRLGFNIDNNATSTQLLTFLTENYGKAAEGAAKTGVAAQDRLNVATENLREALGRGLSPTVTEYTDKLTKWLDTAENQRELQERVNEAVETGEDVVRGFAGALRTVRAVLGPVVDLMGGLDKAIEAALIIGLVSKVRRAALSFGLIGAASGAATAKVVRDAAIAGAALDAAYRPRAVPVGGGPVPGGRGARGGGLVGTLALTAGLIFGPDIVSFLGGLGDGLGADDIAKLRKAARSGRLSSDQLDQLSQFIPAALEAELRRLIFGGVGARPGEGNLGGSGLRPPSRDGRGGGDRRSLLDIQLDIARAETTAGRAADLRLRRELVARLEAQVKALEDREKLTKEQKEKLRSLYGQLASEQSAIDSIIQEGEQRLADQREKARQKERERQEREARLRERHATELRRERDRAFRGGLPPGQARLAGRPTGARAPRRPGEGSAGGGLTEADIRRVIFESLADLHGVIGQFGSNVAGDPATGQVATHALIQSTLLREQNDLLLKMLAGSGFSGTTFARASLASAGLGSGF